MIPSIFCVICRPSSKLLGNVESSGRELIRIALFDYCVATERIKESRLQSTFAIVAAEERAGSRAWGCNECVGQR